jgi:hypothetical protein
MATESPSAVCSLILHEAAEPTEAIDSVVGDFIEPHERMHIELLRVIVPEASQEQLSFFAQSIMSQIMHYRIFKPVLERMAVGDLTDRTKIRSIADHIARFSLRGLGCPQDVVEQAVSGAAKLDKDNALNQRAPK